MPYQVLCSNCIINLFKSNFFMPDFFVFFDEIFEKLCVKMYALVFLLFNWWLQSHYLWVTSVPQVGMKDELSTLVACGTYR